MTEKVEAKLSNNLKIVEKIFNLFPDLFTNKWDGKTRKFEKLRFCKLEINGKKI